MQKRTAMHLGELVSQVKERSKHDRSKDEILEQINVLLQKCPTWCSVVVTEPIRDGISEDSSRNQRIMNAERQHLLGKHRAVFKVKGTGIPFKAVRQSLSRVQQRHIAHVQEMLHRLQQIDN